MHSGELETSNLLATYPEVIRPGNETADWTTGGRPHLHPDGCGRGSWRRPGRPDAAQPADLVGCGGFLRVRSSSRVSRRPSVTATRTMTG